MSKFSFLMNGFKYQIDAPLYNRNSSDPVGYFRESNISRAVPNLLHTTNQLRGDFIAHIFPEGIGQNAGGDLMFDPFLASMKTAGAYAVNSEKYMPFLAIVNIPEITGIATPIVTPAQTMVDRDFKAIKDITTTLGVFRKDNFFGQFAIPSYNDPVLVTFGDPVNLENPIFIEPMMTGEITLNGKTTNNKGGAGTTGPIHKTGYYNQCRKAGKSKKKAKTNPTAAPPTPQPTGQPTSGQGASVNGTPASPKGTGTGTAPNTSKASPAPSQGTQAANTLTALRTFATNVTNAATTVVTNVAQAVKAQNSLILPVDPASGQTILKSQFCKTPAGKGGSLVGKIAGGKPIRNTTSEGKPLNYANDADAKNNGVGYKKRQFPPLNIVLHDTDSFAGVAESLYATFAANKNDKGLSSHYIIGEDGTVLETLNPLLYAGRHAGDTNRSWNDFSIGIDLCCKPYPKRSTAESNSRWDGTNADSAKKVYIGDATERYLPNQPSSDPYKLSNRTYTDLKLMSPPYLTRRKSGIMGAGLCFIDYTEPQKRALYDLIRLLLQKFNTSIAPQCALPFGLANDPDKLAFYPQAFSGVVAHCQVAEPQARGDGHRALDLLVQKRIIKDISGLNTSTYTLTNPGPYWDQRLK